MHQLGVRGKLEIHRANGDKECLVNIDRWDFNWQNDYALVEPTVFNPGDQLYIECHYDNTLSNQPIVDGQPLQPQDRSWGEGTTDEMCLSVFMMSPGQ